MRDLFSADSADVEMSVPAARYSHASRAAAERLTATGVQGPKMHRLMSAYAKAGSFGLTRSELVARTGLLVQSTCSLCAYARKAGWLVNVGERMAATRFTQTVARITPKGMAALAAWQERNSDER